MNPALILRNVPNFDIYSELSLQVGLLWSCLSSYLFAINPFVYLSVFRSSEGGSRNQLRHLESLRFLSAQTILGLLFFLFFFFFLFLLLLFIINTSIGGAVVTWLCPLSLCRWVREFLNEENQGLDVLVEYLSFAQYAVTQVDFSCFFFFLFEVISFCMSKHLLHSKGHSLCVQVWWWAVGVWRWACFHRLSLESVHRGSPRRLQPSLPILICSTSL